MPDYAALWRGLAGIGLTDWRPQIEPLLLKRFSDDAHGDYPQWLDTLEKLRAPDLDSQQRRDYLLALAPWRKGPFNVGGVEIDSEWRSNLKWDRLKDAIEPLAGRTVVDVGCGNGYYALQMRDAGARFVVGVEPMLLYVMQFLAVTQQQAIDNAFVLPLRCQELPANAHAFDTCFSMGVLYHQRSPLAHLQDLKGLLRPSGQLVLETLFVPGDESYACTPADRYARMRNVWLLPTIVELRTWLTRSGFRDIEIVDRSQTTVDEQRSTDWMRFESLAAALDPADPLKTVEGWPAPRRVIVLASAP